MASLRLFGVRYTTSVGISAALLIAGFAQLCTGIPIDNGLVPQEVKGAVTRCTGAEIDMMFVVDGSSSIKVHNFEQIKNFIASLVETAVPDDEQLDTHVGIVQFSGTARTEFALNNHEKRSKLLASIRALPYLQGTTKLGLALEHTRVKELVEDRGDRPDKPTLIIVITDGRSQDDPGPEAEKLRKQGNRMVVVGVTDNIDYDQLLATAGTERAIFTVADFDELNQKLSYAITSTHVCKEVETVPVEAPVSIICNDGNMIINAETKNPFNGQVFVKGRSNDPDCSVQGDGSKTVQFNLDFAKCNAIRRRSLDPAGVFMENTLVYKFHPRFQTKIDVTMSVQCFFMETTKNVGSEVEVSVFTTGFQTETFPMPVCTYSIHSESVNGPEAQYAVVGEPLFHKWACDNSVSNETFAMRVYDCVASDGRDQKVPMLDSNGCSIDKYIMSNLEYASNYMMASVETHAFKFSDISELYFQCQIALCVRLEDGCSNTPPQCDGTGSTTPDRFGKSRRHKRSHYPIFGPDVSHYEVDVESHLMQMIGNQPSRTDETKVSSQLAKRTHGSMQAGILDGATRYCLEKIHISFMILIPLIATISTAISIFGIRFQSCW